MNYRLFGSPWYWFFSHVAHFSLIGSGWPPPYLWEFETVILRLTQANQREYAIRPPTKDFRTQCNVILEYYVHSYTFTTIIYYIQTTLRTILHCIIYIITRYMHLCGGLMCSSIIENFYSNTLANPVILTFN